MAMEVPSEWEAIGMSAFRTPAAALLWTRPPEGSDFILSTTFLPSRVDWLSDFFQGREEERIDRSVPGE